MKTSVSILLIVIMLTVFFGGSTVASADAAQSQRWNIMLVIDGSGSLFSGMKTDPEGMRYEAVNSLLDTIPLEGNNIGAIVFSGNTTKDASEKAMFSDGILLDTGLIEMPTDPDNKDQAATATKEQLKKTIAGAVDHRSNGLTDVPTALYAAVKDLEAANNGLPSAIFLFTDGETNVTGDVKDKSDEYKASAISKIQADGIKVCGIYLNSEGRQDSSEVHDLICDIYGMNKNSINLYPYYSELNSNADLSDARDMFLYILGTKSSDSSANPVFTDYYSESFTIPGIGVEEANILIETVGGDSLPSGMKVSITKPDNSLLLETDSNVIVSEGRTYKLFKIKMPQSGTWSVEIVLPKGNKVEIKYNPKFSTYVEADLISTPSADLIHSNMDVPIQAVLMQNGVVLTDPAAYKEYKCRINLYNVNTGKTETVDVSPNSSNEYKIIYHTTGHDNLQVTAEFYCTLISAESQPQLWILGNHIPEASDASVTIKYGLLQKGVLDIDLNDYISDIEDGQNLEISIDNSTCNIDGITLSGKTLTVDAAKSGSGDVALKVTDSDGESTVMHCFVTAKNVTVRVIVMLLIALIVLIAILFIILWMTRLPNMDGNTNFTMTLPPEATGKQISMDFIFPTNTPGKTDRHRNVNLWTYVHRDLENGETSQIRQVCESSGIFDFDQLSSWMNSDGKAILSKITLGCAKIENPDEETRSINKNVGALRVKAPGTNEVLYDGSTVCYVGDSQVNVEYSVSNYY